MTLGKQDDVGVVRVIDKFMDAESVDRRERFNRSNRGVLTCGKS